MASLHRRKNSPFWFVAFNAPDPDNPGKLRAHFKSTKARDKKDALAKAREIEAATVAEAGAGDEKGRAVYSLLKKAADLAAAGRLSEAQGRVFLSELVGLSSGSQMKRYTTRQWCHDWLSRKTEAHAKPGGKGGKPRPYARATYLRYECVVRQFLAAIPNKADEDLSALTGDDVRQFRDTLATEGRSAATANDGLKVIRVILNAARRAGVILTNPAEAVELFPEAETIKDVFQPEDVARLLNVASPDWQGAIRLGWFTGMALRDATNLRWAQIDLDAQMISHSRRKTGTPIKTPIHPDLLTWLIDLDAPDDPAAFLFPGLAGKSSAGRNGLSLQFNRLMALAGIECRTEAAPGEKGRKRRALGFHALRHSFVSAMANAGVAVEVRQALAGHASAEMNAVYSHLGLDPLRAAIGTLAGIGKGGR